VRNQHKNCEESGHSKRKLNRETLQRQGLALNAEVSSKVELEPNTFLFCSLRCFLFERDYFLWAEHSRVKVAESAEALEAELLADRKLTRPIHGVVGEGKVLRRDCLGFLGNPGKSWISHFLADFRRRSNNCVGGATDKSKAGARTNSLSDGSGRTACYLQTVIINHPCGNAQAERKLLFVFLIFRFWPQVQQAVVSQATNSVHGGCGERVAGL
jgi:hypothetical protein